MEGIGGGGNMLGECWSWKFAGENKDLLGCFGQKITQMVRI